MPDEAPHPGKELAQRVAGVIIAAQHLVRAVNGAANQTPPAGRMKNPVYAQAVKDLASRPVFRRLVAEVALAEAFFITQENAGGVVTVQPLEALTVDRQRPADVPPPPATLFEREGDYTMDGGSTAPPAFKVSPALERDRQQLARVVDQWPEVRVTAHRP